MRSALQALSLINAPRVLMQMVVLLYMANGPMPEDLHMAEYFAGKMEVACPYWNSLYFILSYVCWLCFSTLCICSNKVHPLPPTVFYLHDVVPALRWHGAGLGVASKLHLLRLTYWGAWWTSWPLKGDLAVSSRMGVPTVSNHCPTILQLYLLKLFIRDLR